MPQPLSHGERVRSEANRKEINKIEDCGSDEKFSQTTMISN
jgi:hypothetical protein